MIKQRSQTLLIWFQLWDILTMSGAWIMAYFIRFSSYLPITKEQPPFEQCLYNLPAVAIAVVPAFRLAKAYEVQRLNRLREDIWSVIKGTLFTVFIVMGIGFYTQDPYVSRGAMSLFAALGFLGVIFTRRLSWWGVHFLRSRGYNPTFSVVVGTGRVARKTASALRRATWMGIRNVGFIENNPTRWSSDLDILGTIDDLPNLIHQYKISHVFIALPMNRFHEARKVFDVLSQEMVEVRLLADLPALTGFSLRMSILDGMPMLGLRETPHYGANIIIKRVMDIVISSIFLIVISPLLIFVALLVKFTSKGPVFYRQERCGLNGKSFQMLKFRTMRPDAEKETGPVWTKQNDERKTTIGNFLRKTSIDELPQFINVVLGHMSIVGPRPERPVFIEKFRKTVPNYMIRHSVKCGITGWAQVNGWRGNTSLRRRVQFDLYYITHWNPWFDIKIMLMTVWNGFLHRNAY
ncbi:MAG: undecaprenyl-phosphate glucose phosphotransferase [Zavarzinella sp.]